MQRFLSNLLITLSISLFVGLLPVTSAAQTFTLNGQVIDSKTGKGLSGVNVVVTGPAINKASGDATDLDGNYTVEGLPAGKYEITVTSLGYKANTTVIELAAGQSATVDFTLLAEAVLGQEVVISISRRKEKILEAPGAVEVVNSEQIEAQPTISPVDHLEGMAAVDVVSTGLSQRNVVVRGFNNIFSGSLLSLTDNRIARVPSLRLNAHNFYTMTNEDIDRIEVVLGPGSALYGPNSANGVFHIITKSPFDSPGTVVSLGGGQQSVFMGSARHAGIINNKIGYKFSAQYYQGEDWESYDDAEPALIKSGTDTISNARDFDITKFAGEGRLDYRISDDMTLIVNGGINQATNLEATGLGWAQADNWRYSYFQGRLLYKSFFAQAFYNKSDAGDSRLLRPDSLSLLVDKSSLFVVQLQHGYEFGDRQQFTYGIDVLRTRPESEKTIYGRNDDDDDVDEFGVYVQSETAVTDQLDLVLAGRYDDHNRLEDPVISPRAALVYKPTPKDNFRVTYNRAYSTPTTNNLFLDLIASSAPMPVPTLVPFLGPTLFDVYGRGVPETGFNFRFDPVDGRAQMISLYGGMLGAPNTYMAPDVNSIWPAIRALTLGTQPELAALLPEALGSTVPGVLMVLNTDYDADAGPSADNQPFVLPSRAVANIKPIKETTTTTYELGYKGLITDRMLLNASIYQSKIDDFVGPLSIETPHVFMDGAAFVGVLAADITPRLIAAGLPPDAAQAQAVVIATGIAEQFGQLPIGLISPIENQNATDVVVTYRNFDDSITLTGGEIGFTYLLNDAWTLGGNFAYVDQNFFGNLDGVADVALNAPKSKFAFRLGYNDFSRGFNAKVQLRHVGKFRSVSDIANGEVDAYTLVDLKLGYDLPIQGYGRTRLTLSVQNLLDEEHYQFVGTPKIGRLTVARITQWF